MEPLNTILFKRPHIIMHARKLWHVRVYEWMDERIFSILLARLLSGSWRFGRPKMAITTRSTTFAALWVCTCLYRAIVSNAVYDK